MSKELAKKVLVPEGIPMPKGVTLHKGHKIEYVPFPCVVKPCCGGSSVGVSIAHNEKEFEDALDEAFSYEDTVLVEEFVDGREFSVAVLDGKALPVIEIEPLEGFYDYKNKYPAAGLLRYFRGENLVVINKQPTPADAMANLLIHAPIGRTLDPDAPIEV